MNKQNVAVFFGGISSEYSVSLESASAVISNLNPDKYTAVPVGITHDGAWFYFTGSPEQIRQDTWCNDIDCIPAALSPNRGSHQLMLFLPDRTERVTIDAAFPVMHGRGGEDGTLQGLVEMSGIPLVGCGVLASALCMDKDRAHRLAQADGIAVPKALCIRAGYDISAVLAFAEQIDYPLFVKPVKAGSSFGVTRIQQEQDLLPAIALAFRYDDTVILEEHIEGFEVGCAVMGYDKLTVGEVDEIELSGGFFDFTEKYTLKTSAIHVPARIDDATAERIKQTARSLYRILGCSGFARVDMFLTPDGRIVFNEINTIPGFTEHSRFPGMMKAAGITFPEMIERLIEEAMTQ